MTMTKQQVWRPWTLQEVVSLTGQLDGRYCFTAGGTWLRTQWEAGTLEEPEHLIAVDRVPELQSGAAVQENYIEIGAFTTLTDVLEHPAVLAKLPVLVEACKQIAAPSIRHQATIGGNICTRTGDAVPALLVYDAVLLWYGSDGLEEESLEAWLMRETEEERLLTAVRIYDAPEEVDDVVFALKSGRRETFIPSQVTVAGRLRIDPQGNVLAAAIACGGGSAVPKRMPKTESLFCRSSTRKLFPALMHDEIKREYDPPSDVFASAEYKKRVAANLIVGEWYRKGRDHAVST
ncbi:FAD binding domain-containing protein [Alkalicoccus chagannorensis]|uniref:FAD binding domain-containing protein n=1 Tax=Alkalicoccus chagannorensis TaxID=427072 RepID=UPI0004079AB7|nr:FAD binding domain-containing protein [Alkalicoccus chagannorensis]